jgi:membrane-associated phospholipid phosphatase
VAKEKLNALHQYNTFPWIEILAKNSVSKAGLMEAGKDILVWIGKALFIVILTMTCAYLFWYARAWISTPISHSYKWYVIWLDSTFFNTVPSLWAQQHIRHDIFDIFFRRIWFSYVYVLLFGATFIYTIRGQTKRYILSLIFVLTIGLVIHFIIPTQPPWMAVEEVVRIDGERFSQFDKNLTAAMPSIHQAVICLFGCALWACGILGKIIAILYNMLMALAVIYLGEHFFVDSIGGCLLAISCWILVKQIYSHKSPRVDQMKFSETGESSLRSSPPPRL